MDELLAKERAAYEYVRSLQSNQDTPFKDTLEAFKQYRAIVQTTAFEKFSDAERLEKRLWQQHTETRQLLARTLKDLRKTPEQKVVEIRLAVEMYLRFIKQSVSFYRSYIYHLSTRFGGVVELQAVAQQVKSGSTDEVEAGMTIDAELRQQILDSCFRTLIYLGDLCRYRASDNLDSQQDFGPALGFYGLACTIKPASGWSYHQQGVVALEQKDHLRAIYYLYRSVLAPEPLPMAKKNLTIQFEKASLAWDKGELIARGSLHDPAASEKALVGWFVRLHSICVKGEPFRGYEELLRELLSRLKSVSHQRPLNAKLRRMTFVNCSAQHTAMENYKALQTPQNEQAFYYSMHINILFFTTLLEMLQEELVATARDPKLVDADLAQKITATMMHMLPVLRLYSSWLVLNVHLVLGLATNSFLASSIARFWQVYAQDLDIISFVFPIWDLEECSPVTYLLEEGVETLGFLPLLDQESGGLVHRSFFDSLGNTKLKFSDAGVHRLEPVEEALDRMLKFLEVGSHVATGINGTPIAIRGTRFSLGADAALFHLPRPPTPPPPKPVEPPKPLSYAAAAAAARRTAVPTVAAPLTGTDASQDDQTALRADQLHRMVETLVDDDDIDQPVTPPQSASTHTTVINGTNDVLMTGLSPIPKTHHGLTISPSTTIVPATAFTREHKKSYLSKAKEDLSDFSPRPRSAADKGASLWSPSSNLSSSFNQNAVSHQRGGSSTSIRSATSPHLVESWSSVDSAPRSKHFSKGSFSNGIAASGALQQGLASSPADRVMVSPQQLPGNQNASPLLFGSGSIWSANPSTSPRADFGG